MCVAASDVYLCLCVLCYLCALIQSYSAGINVLCCTHTLVCVGETPLVNQADTDRCFMNVVSEGTS